MNKKILIGISMILIGAFAISDMRRQNVINSMNQVAEDMTLSQYELIALTFNPIEKQKYLEQQKHMRKLFYDINELISYNIALEDALQVIDYYEENWEPKHSCKGVPTVVVETKTTGADVNNDGRINILDMIAMRNAMQR